MQNIANDFTHLEEFMNHYKKLSIMLIYFLILFSHQKCYCFEPWQLVYSNPELNFTDIASNDTTIIVTGFKGGVFVGNSDSTWNVVNVKDMPVMNSISKRSKIRYRKTCLVL
jgi:hypothetical protein